MRAPRDRIDCQCGLKPSTRPFLVCAGTSGRGMRFTATEMDAMFIGGQDDAEIEGISTGAKAIAADAGKALRTDAMTTLVIADRDAAAQAQADAYRAGFDEGAFRGMLKAYAMVDSEIGKEDSFTASARSGFMSARILGSADTEAARLAELLEQCRLDGVMLIFPDCLRGIPLEQAQLLPPLCYTDADFFAVRGRCSWQEESQQGFNRWLVPRHLACRQRKASVWLKPAG